MPRHCDADVVDRSCCCFCVFVWMVHVTRLWCVRSQWLCRAFEEHAEPPAALLPHSFQVPNVCRAHPSEDARPTHQARAWHSVRGRLWFGCACVRACLVCGGVVSLVCAVDDVLSSMFVHRGPGLRWVWLARRTSWVSCLVCVARNAAFCLFVCVCVCCLLFVCWLLVACCLLLGACCLFVYLLFPTWGVRIVVADGRAWRFH